MSKMKGGEVDKAQEVAQVSLAFRVKPVKDGLYAAEMLMLLGDVVADSRHGIATTLGHAIGAADDLLDGWAFSEIEQKPENYFHDVLL